MAIFDAVTFALVFAFARRLWPAGLAPLWIGASARRKGWRGALRDAAWIAVGLALPALPFVSRAGLGIFGFLQFQSERALQLESLWANLSLLLDAARDSASRISSDLTPFYFPCGTTSAMLALSRSSCTA